jgi:hypothetical protein
LVGLPVNRWIKVVICWTVWAAIVLAPYFFVPETKNSGQDWWTGSQLQAVWFYFGVLLGFAFCLLVSVLAVEGESKP